MNAQIQLRRDIAANWTSEDPILADGEIGIEKDTNRIKIGDGATAWSSLAYFGGGTPGTPGSVWYEGSGAPSGGTGIDGDYYLDVANGDVYQKATGSWSSIGNIKGATGAAGSNGTNGTNGAPGSVWYEGSGAPSGGTGIDGDYYLDVANGDVYQKATGSWSSIGNIKGPAGTGEGVLGNQIFS